MRVPSPLLIALLLGSAPFVSAAGFKSCLQGCDAKGSTVDCCNVIPDLESLCASYLDDVTTAREAYPDCISTDHRVCQPTGSGGGCRILLEGCIRPCENIRSAQIGRATRLLIKRINGHCSDNDPDCTPLPDQCRVRGSAARKLAARVCQKHCSITPTTSTTTSPTTSTTVDTSISITTTTTTSTATKPTKPPPPTIANEGDFGGCLKNCILGIDSLKGCYDRCDDNCEGNRDALSACRQGCRNNGCGTIGVRCVVGSPKTDPGYAACCDPSDACDSNNCCRTHDDLGDICVPTTTTTSTSTTTVTTVTVTSSSTSSTPPSTSITGQ